MKYVLFCMSAFFLSNAHAHLMPRNHGTLNLTNGKAYIVLSLPISEFRKSEAKGAVADGVLTPKELKSETQRLKTAILKGVVLTHQTQPLQIGSILLNLPKGPHHTPERSTEITAMIVVPLKNAAGAVESIDMTMSLWGRDTKTFKLKTTVTQFGKIVRSAIVEFTPNAPHRRVVESFAP